MYDYLIVGAGPPYGAVFAHEAKKAGKKVLVIDRRQILQEMCIQSRWRASGSQVWRIFSIRIIKRGLELCEPVRGV